MALFSSDEPKDMEYATGRPDGVIVASGSDPAALAELEAKIRLASAVSAADPTAAPRRGRHMTRPCVVCGTAFAPRPGPGRPPLTCSPECLRRRERDLNRKYDHDPARLARLRQSYAARKAAGVCCQFGCRKRPKPGHAYCPACLAWRNEVTKLWKRKVARMR